MASRGRPRLPDDMIAHGTERGHQAENRRKREHCIPCMVAHSVYRSESEQSWRCADGLGWPLLPGSRQVSRRGWWTAKAAPGVRRG